MRLSSFVPQGAKILVESSQATPEATNPTNSQPSQKAPRNSSAYDRFKQTRQELRISLQEPYHSIKNSGSDTQST